LRLFIWGWAEYSDVFKDTSLHRTEFCREVLITSMGKDEATGKTSAAVRFVFYGPYNTAK
jgi:hypothetical protein